METVHCYDLANTTGYNLRLQLTLTLLVLGIFADHAHNPAAADDLALITNLLYRCPYLHKFSVPCQFSAVNPPTHKNRGTTREILRAKALGMTAAD
jgi:hypothetical protein